MKKIYKRNWLFKLKSLAVFGALFFAGTASAQMSGNYTIDTSMAMSSTNFHSFSEFQDSLDALGLSGAITVDVANITYDESFEINDVTGSSSTNTITINGNNALLTSGDAETINIEEQSYVTIKHLRIRNTSSAGECMVIQGDGTSFITVDSSEFIKTGNRTSSASVYLMISEGGNAFGAGSDEKTDITISNNFFHNEGGTSNGGYAGIAVHQDPSEGGDQNILIENNRISCWGRYAITLEDVSGVDIIGNEIFNPSNYFDGFRTAIYQFNNFAFVGAEEACLISENYIHSINRNTYTGTSYAIQWYDYYNENNVDIENNIINLDGRGSLYGIYPYGAFTFYTATPGSKNIQNNSIRLAGTSGSNFSTLAGVYGFNLGTSEIRNNIVQIERANAARTFGIYYQTGGNVSFNNVWFNNTNVTNERYTAQAFNNNGPATVTEFLTAFPNSVSTDALFTDVAAGDYTPQSIGMANKGSSAAGITTDYNGDARSATTPDLGAVEYFVDIEVVSVDMIGGSECAPYSEAVVVTLQNNGTNAVSGIPMKYSVNGGTEVQEVVSTSITAGGTSQFTFANVPDFFGSVTHVITVAVDGEDDMPTNSSDDYTITTTASPFGGDLSEGSMFDGYFNDGNMANPDVTVNTYVSEYDITDPAVSTNYGYTLTATTMGGTDVTSSGFSLTNSDKTVTMDPAVSLAGETIFVEIEVLDNSTGCDTAFGRYLYVPHTPVPSFEASDICLGDIAQFKNTSTLAGPDYIVTNWKFNDPDATVMDDSSDILNGFWEYTTYSTSPVTVEMTVANGVYPKFKYTTTRQINVTAKPEIDFKVLNACEGSPITVVDNTINPAGGSVAYDWDFGGEWTSTSSNPSYTFPTAGQRTITLVASANGCESMLTKNAYQFETPVAAFTSTGACNFVPVDFTNASTLANNGNMGYAWDFASEGIAREENPSFAFATPGTKTVTLTATSEFGCVSTTTETVTLNESPEADFEWDQACNLTPINFTRTGSVPNGGTNSTYSWDFDGQSTTNQENPSYLFSKVGPRAVTLTIADLNGCTNAITKEVNVVLQAVANFDAEDACEGDEVVFTNKSEVAAGNLSYEWRFGDATTSTDLNPTHVYGESKEFDVTLSAKVEGGCSDEVTKKINVFASPDASFTVDKGGRNVTVTATDAGNDVYNWTFGNGGKDQGANSTADYTYVNVDEGTYEICLATREGNCWSEECQTVEINLAGIENLTQSNDMISVYPNPSQGQFTVKVDNASDVVVKVGDILGNVIGATVIDNLNGTYSVDMSAVADGVYFVQVKNGDYYATKRITISK